MNAKTAVLTGAHQVEVREYPIPAALEDGVLIQTEAAGICGSDGHIITLNPPVPSNMGHEFVGRIVDMGARANDTIHSYGGRLAVGDRVAVYPWITCNHCASCEENGAGVCGVCEGGFLYGAPPLNPSPGMLNTDPDLFPHFKGGFGEYVYLFPGSYVWKVPDSVPSEIAALLDPLAVACRAIELAMAPAGTLQEGVSTNTRALVVGAGPIGVMTAMVLKRMGCEQVVISDFFAEKLARAKRIAQADDTVDTHAMTSDERVAAVRDLTHGGADLVVQCANSIGATIEGLRMVRALGTFIEIGNAMDLAGKNVATLNLSEVLFSKNARISAVVANYPKTYTRAFRLLLRHNEIPFGELITHRFHDLTELEPTIGKMGRTDYMKGVMTFG